MNECTYRLANYKTLLDEMVDWEILKYAFSDYSVEACSFYEDYGGQAVILIKHNITGVYHFYEWGWCSCNSGMFYGDSVEESKEYAFKEIYRDPRNKFNSVEEFFYSVFFKEMTNFGQNSYGAVKDFYDELKAIFYTRFAIYVPIEMIDEFEWDPEVDSVENFKKEFCEQLDTFLTKFLKDYVVIEKNYNNVCYRISCLKTDLEPALENYFLATGDLIVARYDVKSYYSEGYQSLLNSYYTERDNNGCFRKIRTGP